MIEEDAPVNNVGSGAIAGTVGDPPVSRKAQKKIQRREKSTPTPVIINMLRRKAPIAEECETFAGAVVFEVSTEVFYNTKNQKRKHKTWRKYLEEDDCLAEIREYANRNPGPIILKNRNTGEMTYARYGKRR